MLSRHFLVSFTLLAGSVFAATTREDGDLLKFTEEEVSRDLRDIEKHEEKLQAELQQKIKTFHSYQNGASQPSFIWEDGPGMTHKRGSLKKILSLSIQSGLQMLSVIQDQKAALINERELLMVEKERRQKEEISGSDKFLNTQKVNYSFTCRGSPLLPNPNIQAQILESFGQKNDKETGVKWRSQGWWVGLSGATARSCAEGEVVFSGPIPGRGWVIMMDHGQGVMTVYANLLAESINTLVQKGQKIAVGTSLGSVKERFYFEARLAGKSVDPKKVFNTHSLLDFNL